MSTPQYPYPPTPPPPPEGSNLKTALAGGAIVASLVANVFLFVQQRDMKEDGAKNRELIQAQIETLKENSTVMTAAQRKKLEDLRSEVDTRARQLGQQASQAASQAKKDAVSYADEQAKKLSNEQQQTAQKFSSEITDVKQKADSANSKLADVGTEVSGVKADLAGTKTELTNTISNLKKVAGDLGETSGFVATNSKELNELKKRGERNYIEFKISKTKDFQKVGDIALLLKKVDQKKNRFTLEVNADDKKTEKKDRYINEPLQFYVSRSLYELVINSVGKDQISGYLSTPKYGNAR